jgi:hypothetical protein
MAAGKAAALAHLRSRGVEQTGSVPALPGHPLARQGDNQEVQGANILKRHTPAVHGDERR